MSTNQGGQTFNIKDIDLLVILSPQVSLPSSRAFQAALSARNEVITPVLPDTPLTAGRQAETLSC